MNITYRIGNLELRLRDIPEKEEILHSPYSEIVQWNSDNKYCWTIATFEYDKNGGAFMLSALCMTGILGFLEFLKSAVFVVRIYSGRKFISRTFIIRRRKKLFRTNGKRE